VTLLNLGCQVWQTSCQEATICDSISKLKLISFSYWSERYNIKWESGEDLFICGFLLELPPFLWTMPYPPTYDVGSWSIMFHLKKVISILKQVFHTRDVQPDKVVRRNKNLGNPNVSYSKHTALPFKNWRWDFTQGMRCNDIASIALRSTPIPLLHSLISTKLECMYKNHYELFLLSHPQLELH
jgi:hypothetical protein